MQAFIHSQLMATEYISQLVTTEYLIYRASITNYDVSDSYEEWRNLRLYDTLGNFEGEVCASDWSPYGMGCSLRDDADFRYSAIGLTSTALVEMDIRVVRSPDQMKETFQSIFHLLTYEAQPLQSATWALSREVEKSKFHVCHGVVDLYSTHIYDISPNFEAWDAEALRLHEAREARDGFQVRGAPETINIWLQQQGYRADKGDFWSFACADKNAQGILQVTDCLSPTKLICRMFYLGDAPLQPDDVLDSIGFAGTKEFTKRFGVIREVL